MDGRRISLIFSAASLALTATAVAGPTGIASSQVVTPQIQTDPIHYYYRHHYRHDGWYRGRHYGRYRHRYHPTYYYGWNPAATVTFAAGTDWPYYRHYRPYYTYYDPDYYD
jgi:hypothetical protein